jgi:hypothetical protein
MSMREVGTCGHDSCRQLSLLWEDGYCCDDCREEATGCPVPFCTCADGRGTLVPTDQPVTGDRST